MHEAPLAWLASHGAQRDVIDGVREISADWKTLWTSCARGDWLLGIAVKLGADHAALVRAASGSARVALDHVEGDLREACVRVLESAEAWAASGAGADIVAARTKELEAASASAVDPASDAGLRASLAVGLGVADRDVLASAPACAAEATIVATMDCGLAMAMRWAHDKCAAAVRSAIPYEQIEALVSGER